MKAFLIIVSIIGWIVFGCLSCDLRSKKGYDGGFLMGFLFGIFALIYNAGIPDLIIRDQLKNIVTPRINYLIKKANIQNLQSTTNVTTLAKSATIDKDAKPETKHSSVAE